MHDDLRRFSTESFACELRASAWDEALALAQIRREPGDAAAGADLEGHVCLRRSPQGGFLVRMNASPQSWVPQAGAHLGVAVNLMVIGVLDGSAQHVDGLASSGIQAGQLLVLDPSEAWRLNWSSNFRCLIVGLSSAAFVARLMRSSAGPQRVIDGSSALGSTCWSLVRSLADEIERLGTDELLPLEAALSDLLVACLSQQRETLAAESTSVQLLHLRRVCRTIEAQLGNAELDLDEVARQEGLSTRYIQRLLKSGGTSFSEYLKERRLERCRLDFINRALSSVSIAEICYRWGFGDAANFSRAFAARFGLSPKAYRADPPRVEQVVRHRGQPLRSNAELVGASKPTGLDAAQGSFCEVMQDHADYTRALALAPKRANPTAKEAGGQHHYVPVSESTVHWGYFSRSLRPVITVRSGDVVTLETLTQHATDDVERMVKGDAGAESVFHWTPEHKAVKRRGAGPMDASVYGRGAGEGFGVHICTGPVHVQDAEPGDVLEVRILDVMHRPSAHPAHRGRIFGSNAAAWWGFQYADLVTEPRQREVITLYEIHPDDEDPHATAVYNYRWTPQTDPDGVRHDTIDYPGVPVDEHSVYKRYGVLAGACVPIRPHFGVLAVAPKESELVDSIPPGYFGGNLDNWRAGKGARLYLPVSVRGALFSAGDPHASQGDGEVCGTAIECSLTGVFQLVLHKRADMTGTFLGELNFPFLETDDAWVLQGLSIPNHLAELGAHAQSEIYARSSLDEAMRDAFRKVRRYLMVAHQLDEDEAVSLMSVAVDFGVTQVADGNWGVHAVIPKSIFRQREARVTRA
jgi:acetamidase/formamidase/AraC-like DNA-binding protein